MIQVVEATMIRKILWMKIVLPKNFFFLTSIHQQKSIVIVIIKLNALSS